MCQQCVDKGEMTAEELATRLASGDKSVIALVALEPEDFKVEIVTMTIAAVLEGMDPAEAVDMALRITSAYVRARDIPEAAMDSFVARLAEI